MINQSFTTHPAAIQPQQDSQNNTDDIAGISSGHTKAFCHNKVCATSAINQVNTPENTKEASLPEIPSKPGWHTVSTDKKAKRNSQEILTSENRITASHSENKRKHEPSAIIVNDILNQPDRLIPKNNQWLNFLQDFYQQTPIPASSISKILSLQTQAGEVDEIIFLVEDTLANAGFGNFNLFIEFLRNFVRLSPGTLNLIRFSGCEDTLRDKLPILISGLPDCEINGCFMHREKKLSLSLQEKGSNKIFGIPYIIQLTNPVEFSSQNILQIYTVWDPFIFLESRKVPLIKIFNYRFFPHPESRHLLQNKENHLPIYPYEVSRNTSTAELMKKEIANSLQTLQTIDPETHDYDTEKLAQFFTELLQAAKDNKIYLALSYHACGMSNYKYYNYTTVAKACFSNKPIIIIAPINEDRDLSEHERIELVSIGKVQFSTNYSLDLTTDKSLKDNVTVFEFDCLPKRLFELVCYFSNIPIYAPGASTANIAQCLNKPYLGHDGHEMPTIGKQQVLGRWKVVNDAFDFNSIRMHKIKPALLTMSKEHIKLSEETSCNFQLNMIFDAITDPILNITGLISTLLPYFFNGADTSTIHEYPSISADDRKRYFNRLLDENRLPDFCQYVCDQSNAIILDYMSRATTPGDTFYELARELQQKALHPDNNMMFEVLENNLPNYSNRTR